MDIAIIAHLANRLGIVVDEYVVVVGQIEGDGVALHVEVGQIDGVAVGVQTGHDGIIIIHGDFNILIVSAQVGERIGQDDLIRGGHVHLGLVDLNAELDPAAGVRVARLPLVQHVRGVTHVGLGIAKA